MAKKRSKKKKSSRRNGSSRSDIDRMFADGEPAEKFYNLPSDTYEGHIKAGTAIIELKPDKVNYKAVFTLVVESPDEYKDKEQVARFDLSTQVGVNIFLAELATMDVGEPKSLREAAEMLEQLDNLAVRFWVSEPEDEYPPKVRINDLLEAGNGKSSSKDDGNGGGDEYTRKDIVKLGKDADKDDTNAIDELTTLAKESKIDPDKYDTWVEVADEVIDDLGL